MCSVSKRQRAAVDMAGLAGSGCSVGIGRAIIEYTVARCAHQSVGSAEYETLDRTVPQGTR